MKHGIYSIRDNCAAAFIPPFFLPNDDMAIRAFSNSCNDQEHMFCRNSEDYSLYYLGDFDDETGVITVPVEPRFMGKGISYKRGA